MDNANFVLLQPRRYRAAGANVVTARATNDAEADEVAVVASATTCADEANISHTVDNESPLREDPEPEPVHLPGADWPSDFPMSSDDGEERLAHVREEAIRIAAVATARALRTALAHDASALTQYVDDALRACGRLVRAKVALHPADVVRYRPRRDVDVFADESSDQGDVAVETDAGSVRASIEQRAALLARRAAYA